MRPTAVLLLTAFWLCAPAAFAGDADSDASQPQPSASTVTSAVRQDSLEMPGVTACHQCEWRPKPNQMAAGDQCGTAPDGAPRLGLYECGFSPDCDRVCNFVDCLK